MGKERLARYSLAGAENRAAVEAGLAGGDWFRSDVPRKRMKELMRAPTTRPSGTPRSGSA